MSLRRYLQTKTREPQFLWRMAIAILLAGLCIGQAVDRAVDAWIIPGQPIDSAPAPAISQWVKIEKHAAAGEWAAVWRGIPAAMVNGWRRVGLTSLAVLTGACWYAFALQSIQIRSWRDIRLWGPVAALVLGVLSIWPTLFLMLWQEHRWGLVESEELAGGVKFFILSVGLREELAKLVCFLPLLPFVVRARDELAALWIASCVGLGFAMEENVTYIAGSAGSATLMRLLNPPPIHMALTGLVGLAAYRAVRWPREWGPQFVAVFGVAVLAHGMYDAFLSVPALVEYSIASGAIFVLMMYQWFREMRPLQQLRVEAVSLTANFVFCVSTVAAASFVYLCAAVGWRDATDVLAQGILAQAVTVYLFIREMPERLVSV